MKPTTHDHSTLLDKKYNSLWKRKTFMNFVASLHLQILRSPIKKIIFESLSEYSIISSPLVFFGFFVFVLLWWKDCNVQCLLLTFDT